VSDGRIALLCLDIIKSASAERIEIDIEPFIRLVLPLLGEVVDKCPDSVNSTEKGSIGDIRAQMYLTVVDSVKRCLVHLSKFKMTGTNQSAQLKEALEKFKPKLKKNDRGECLHEGPTEKLIYYLGGGPMDIWEGYTEAEKAKAIQHPPPYHCENRREKLKEAMKDPKFAAEFHRKFGY
jgi:hypothetical protein